MTCNLTTLIECFKELPPSLNTLRTMFTEVLRFVYSNPSNFADYADDLSCLTYNENPALSKIEIGPATQLDPGNTEHVPSILVSFKTGIQYTPMGMNSVAFYSEDLGTSKIINFGTATCTLIHRHLDGDIACKMSDISVLMFSILRATLPPEVVWLHTLQVSVQTEPKLNTSQTNSQGYYESNLDIEVVMQLNTEFRPEALRIKGLELSSE